MDTGLFLFIFVPIMNYRITGLLLLCILATGCEKTIDFDLKDQEQKLVVEAEIENGQVPVVTLMKSVGYFDELSLSALSQTFVHNAEVYISNGPLTHRLKEYSIPVLPGISLYYYSIDSSDLATAFSGELEHSYSLRILSEGKEYTANTTIPKITKVIDSLYWKPAPATSDTNKVVIMVKATDPPGFGDYIRYFTKTNSQPRYLPPYNSVFDDLFVDGTTYEVQLEGGVDRNVDTTDDDFWFRGDTVNFKLSNIDRASFDFWRTWEFSYQSVGNPFSTPNKVLGNIRGGALGYFAGYASQYRSLIIPQ